jgi:hypothetical protein
MFITIIEKPNELPSCPMEKKRLETLHQIVLRKKRCIIANSISKEGNQIKRTK